MSEKLSDTIIRLGPFTAGQINPFQVTSAALINELRDELLAVRKIHEEFEGRCVECVEYCECTDATCTHGNVDWPCRTAVAGGFA